MEENPTWRKSKRSGSQSNCVEVRKDGAVRDSKNPTGPFLRFGGFGLAAAAKAGRITK